MKDRLTPTKTMNFLIYLVLCLVPLILVPIGGRLETMRPKLVGLGLLSLAFLIHALRHRDEIALVEGDRENLYLAAYVFLALLATLFSIRPDISFWGSGYRYDGFLALILYVFAYLMARNGQNMERVLFHAVTFTAVLVASYGIIQFYHLVDWPGNLYFRDWEGKAYATMGNPNFLGSFLTLTLPIPLYLYFYKDKFYGLLAYMVLFLGLLTTRTRGAWIGSFLGLLSFLLYHRLRGKYTRKELGKVLLVVVASVAVLFFFVVTAGDTFFTRFFSIFIDFSKLVRNEEGADLGGSYRVYVWQKVLELIRMRPILGYGLDTMYIAMSEHFKEIITADFGVYKNWDKAHNELLNIALSSGVPSLMFYLAFLKRTIGKGFQKMRFHAAYVPILAAVTGYLVQSMFNIQVVMVYYIFMAFLGILSGKNAFQEKETFYKVSTGHLI